MAISEVEIVNLGLLELGEPFIISLTEGTQAANLANLAYPQIRDAMLVDCMPNFASGRKKLVKSSTDPDFGYNFQFPLPVDYRFALSISERFDFKDIQYGDKLEYKIEGKNLLTNENEAFLSYITKVTDVSFFPALFVEVLSTKIAQKLAFSLLGSVTQVDAMRTLHKDALKKFRAWNARENGIQRPLVDVDAVRPR